MYNTQFKVKYHDIEEELLFKLKVKTPQEHEENTDEEYCYSTDDVLDICDKLFIDEFLSVFGSENMMDDKIDKGMFYVFDIMMKNIHFKQFVNDIAQTFGVNNENVNDANQQIILISLFSKNLFYITHKCICQQIELGTIEQELLDELRKHTIDSLHEIISL